MLLENNLTENEKNELETKSRRSRSKTKKLKVIKERRFYQKFWFWFLISLILAVSGGGLFVWNKYGKMVNEAVNSGYQISESLDKNVLGVMPQQFFTIIKDKKSNDSIHKQIIR